MNARIMAISVTIRLSSRGAMMHHCGHSEDRMDVVEQVGAAAMLGPPLPENHFGMPPKAPWAARPMMPNAANSVLGCVTL